jgi:purine-nucleoside phosphorylase
LNSKKTEKAVRHILKVTKARPSLGVILGSGLGALAEKVTGKVTLPYSAIPNFPVTTVEGHKGNLVLGTISGAPVALMQGRFHFYEGRTMVEVVFPVEVFYGLGVNTLVVTNAAGGIRDDLNPGDIMLITDHINLMGTNPLVGLAEVFKGGERFVDMTGAYDKGLARTAKLAAQKSGIVLKEGVLAALTGPSYETPAEVRMLRALGADAVCMSTVPEVIMARYLGMKVLGLSLIANSAAGICEKGLTHEEVLSTVTSRQVEFATVVEGFVAGANASGLL